MEHDNSIVFEALDNYLKKLDGAPILSNGFFFSESRKEWYETQLMYAFRKYQAAVYHYKNVKKFIIDDEAIMKKSMEYSKELIDKELHGIGSIQSWGFVTQPAHYYVNELSAFLAALRSSIDFLSIVCSCHISGIKTDKINTLIRQVKNGKSGPIFDEVRNNLDWLNKLRSYRDHLVHRSIITATSGHETHCIGDLTKGVRYPVVIPESPSYEPDTRMRLVMEDKPPNLSCYWSKVRIIPKNGKEEIVEFTKKYEPAPGYIAIEDFMQLHIDSYEKFFTQIIQALTDLHFEIYKLK